MSFRLTRCATVDGDAVRRCLGEHGKSGSVRLEMFLDAQGPSR